MTSFTAVMPDGRAHPISRAVAQELPIALEFNGLGYAVMMATPEHLEDFATGFALAERLITQAAEIIDISRHAAPQGILLRVTLASTCVPLLAERVRHRVSDSSCGLCGIENLEQALRTLPPVTQQSAAAHPAIFAALKALPEHQPLNSATGGVHAAALCAANGSIRLAREDVGRHNAFDKLIGAMARQGLDWDAGFALLSARCSFELVEKAVLANCPLLVTISVPTQLALERAVVSDLRLICLARDDAYLVPNIAHQQ